MTEITWIKLKTDMFENDKIKLIEALPDKDTIIVIWVKLLAAAGKANSNGFIMLTENIPMNEEEMATIFNRPLNTVRLALQTFKRYGMIEVENEVIRIRNWESHQNIEGMDRIKEQNRLRKQKQREREKQLQIGHVTSRDSHATDIDKELDRELDKELDRETEREEKQVFNKPGKPADIPLPYETIILYLNSMAGTNYRHTTIKTQKLIKARYAEGFKTEDFKTVIDKKTSDWLHNPEFSKYLRPETLFGTKFESYLNEKVGGKRGAFSEQSTRKYSDDVNF